MDLSQTTLNLNEEKSQYEITVEGQLAYIEFKLNKKGQIFLTHTEVPESMEGKGIGSHLVKIVLAEIRKKGWKLFPLCPFVKAYLQRHPEERDVLDPAMPM